MGQPYKKIPLFVGETPEADPDNRHGKMLSWVEEVGEPLSLLAADYPDGYSVPSHKHRYIQLLYIATGMVAATTSQGRWLVPAEHALWIPSQTIHSLKMMGEVVVNSVYINPHIVEALPSRVRTVGLTDLARSLLLECIEMNTDSPPTRRDELLMALLVEEIPRLPEKPLSLPFPQNASLMGLCLEFVETPNPRATIDDWATRLNTSRRTFTRTFAQETGLSFSLWKQQACLLAALPRLAEGQAITRVAFDLGYESAAAFSTMFRRTFSVSPRTYLASQHKAKQATR